jgi:hypothetical protein
MWVITFYYMFDSMPRQVACASLMEVDSLYQSAKAMASAKGDVITMFVVEKQHY